MKVGFLFKCLFFILSDLTFTLAQVVNRLHFYIGYLRLPRLYFLNSLIFTIAWQKEVFHKKNLRKNIISFNALETLVEKYEYNWFLTF